jgi:hypothetical protein
MWIGFRDAFWVPEFRVKSNIPIERMIEITLTLVLFEMYDSETYTYFLEFQIPIKMF